MMYYFLSFQQSISDYSMIGTVLFAITIPQKTSHTIEQKKISKKIWVGKNKINAKEDIIIKRRMQLIIIPFLIFFKHLLVYESFNKLLKY